MHEEGEVRAGGGDESPLNTRYPQATFWAAAESLLHQLTCPGGFSERRDGMEAGVQGGGAP